jgi:hypothetical protein
LLSASAIFEDGAGAECVSDRSQWVEGTLSVWSRRVCGDAGARASADWGVEEGESVGGGAGVEAASVAEVEGEEWGKSSAGQMNLWKDAAVHRSFWQRRFYDFNVWSRKKRIEKLNYMHMNPVKRGLVTDAKLWAWSSYRFYQYGEENLCTPDGLKD